MRHGLPCQGLQMDYLEDEKRFWLFKESSHGGNKWDSTVQGNARKLFPKSLHPFDSFIG